MMKKVRYASVLMIKKVRCASVLMIEKVVDVLQF